ncbi:MAG: M24 family metallopeptidase [Bacteroidaceae bacterium]|nr:M24 family metallopeptidase [Bacteroidaceae bacterium]
MSTIIYDRLQTVRQWMRQEGLEAFVVPTCDPHNSEYVPAHWMCREWLTGFTGSAGTAVVTLTDARLWTDSRYWIQAAEQLATTPFLFMREGEGESPEEWLRWERLHAVRTYDPRQQPDPFDLWWEDRPAFPLSQAWIMPDEVAGESAQHKLQRLMEWLPGEALLVQELAEVMWVLNLRGNDIPYNPFLISFLRVRRSGQHTLYINKEQISPATAQYLAHMGVSLAPYEQALLSQEAEHDCQEESPVAQWRCTKNEAEEQGFRRAHELDGVAMVRFLRWLEETDITQLTEVDVDARLTALRAESEEYLSLSFGTIAAYGAHAAIVHYEAEPATAARLSPRGLLLLDSGAHYRMGTTDITRTIALGPLTEEERRAYTLVLKGHLQLQALRFPDGALGLQLDTVARMAMWREGLDFGHGTGHGVGHVLGVHEGPHQIRKNRRDCTLLPFHAHQTMTDEPGIYVEGRFGVRIENVLLSREVQDVERVQGGQEIQGGSSRSEWLEWEPLTLCPYDLRPVVLDMLTPEECQWLNDYHTLVRQRLLPLLPMEADREWLLRSTEHVLRD